MAERIEEAGYRGLLRRSPLDLLSPACPARLHHARTNPAESLEVWVPHRFSTGPPWGRTGASGIRTPDLHITRLHLRMDLPLRVVTYQWVS